MNTNKQTGEMISGTAWTSRFGEILAPVLSQASPAWNDLYYLSSIFKRLEKTGRTLSLPAPGPDVNVINEALTATFEWADELFATGEPELKGCAIKLHAAVKSLRRTLADAGMTELARPRVRAMAVSVDDSKASSDAITSANELWLEATAPGASAAVKGRAMAAVETMWRLLPCVSQEGRELGIAEARRNLYGEVKA